MSKTAHCRSIETIKTTEGWAIMLPYYQDLYYLDPQIDFERSVNSNLDTLCFQARGCGQEAIRAQTYLKRLKGFSQDDREQAYERAIAYLQQKPKNTQGD